MTATTVPQVIWQEHASGGVCHAWRLPTLDNPVSLCGGHGDSDDWSLAWPSRLSCLACHAAIRSLVSSSHGAQLVIPPVWPDATPARISLDFDGDD